MSLKGYSKFKIKNKPKYFHHFIIINATNIQQLNVCNNHYVTIVFLSLIFEQHRIYELFL